MGIDKWQPTETGSEWIRGTPTRAMSWKQREMEKTTFPGFSFQSIGDTVGRDRKGGTEPRWQSRSWSPGK